MFCGECGGEFDRAVHKVYHQDITTRMRNLGIRPASSLTRTTTLTALDASDYRALHIASDSSDDYSEESYP